MQALLPSSLSRQVAGKLTRKKHRHLLTLTTAISQVLVDGRRQVLG